MLCFACSSFFSSTKEEFENRRCECTVEAPKSDTSPSFLRQAGLAVAVVRMGTRGRVHSHRECTAGLATYYLPPCLVNPSWLSPTWRARLGTCPWPVLTSWWKDWKRGEDLPCKAPVRLMGGQRERVEGTVNKHSALLVYVGIFQGGFGKISHGRQPATCAGCDSETLPISPLDGRDHSQFIWCLNQMRLHLIKQIQGVLQVPFCCCCCLWVCCQGCLTTLTNVLNKWQAALAGFPCTSNVLLEVNPAVPLLLGRDSQTQPHVLLDLGWLAVGISTRSHVTVLWAQMAGSDGNISSLCFLFFVLAAATCQGRRASVIFHPWSVCDIFYDGPL